LLDHVDVGSEGPLVKVHLVATRDHIETLVALVAGFLGVEPPASSASPGAPAGGPVPPAAPGSKGSPPP
jgi:hypothetical protein